MEVSLWISTREQDTITAPSSESGKANGPICIQKQSRSFKNQRTTISASDASKKSSALGFFSYPLNRTDKFGSVLISVERHRI